VTARYSFGGLLAMIQVLHFRNNLSASFPVANEVLTTPVAGIGPNSQIRRAISGVKRSDRVRDSTSEGNVSGSA
jgi:hypothetical protein